MTRQVSNRDNGPCAAVSSGIKNPRIVRRSVGESGPVSHAGALCAPFSPYRSSHLDISSAGQHRRLNGNIPPLVSGITHILNLPGGALLGLCKRTPSTTGCCTFRGTRTDGTVGCWCWGFMFSNCLAQASMQCYAHFTSPRCAHRQPIESQQLALPELRMEKPYTLSMKEYAHL